MWRKVWNAISRVKNALISPSYHPPAAAPAPAPPVLILQHGYNPVLFLEEDVKHLICAQCHGVCDNAWVTECGSLLCTFCKNNLNLELCLFCQDGIDEKIIPCVRTRRLVSKLTWTCNHCGTSDKVGCATEVDNQNALEQHLAMKGSCSRKRKKREDYPPSLKLSVIQRIQTYQSDNPDSKDAIDHVIRSHNLLQHNLVNDTVRRWLQPGTLEKIKNSVQQDRVVRAKGAGRHSALDPHGGMAGTEALMNKFLDIRNPSQGRYGETGTIFFQNEGKKIHVNKGLQGPFLASKGWFTRERDRMQTLDLEGKPLTKHRPALKKGKELQWSVVVRRIVQFFTDVWELRTAHGLDPDRLIECDELCARYHEHETHIWDYRGNVGDVQASGKEKKTCSVLFFSTANGHKFPPFFIMNAKTNLTHTLTVKPDDMAMPFYCVWRQPSYMDGMAYSICLKYMRDQMDAYIRGETNIYNTCPENNRPQNKDDPLVNDGDNQSDEKNDDNEKNDDDETSEDETSDDETSDDEKSHTYYQDKFEKLFAELKTQKEKPEKALLLNDPVYMMGLIDDDASAHKDRRAKEVKKLLGIASVMLGGGITGKAQAKDTMQFRSLRGYVKRLEQSSNDNPKTEREWRDHVITLFCKAWKEVRKETIIRSNKKNGTAVNPDGSEDNQVNVQVDGTRVPFKQFRELGIEKGKQLAKELKNQANRDANRDAKISLEDELDVDEPQQAFQDVLNVNEYMPGMFAMIRVDEKEEGKPYSLVHIEEEKGKTHIKVHWYDTRAKNPMRGKWKPQYLRKSGKGTGAVSTDFVERESIICLPKIILKEHVASGTRAGGYLSDQTVKHLNHWLELAQEQTSEDEE